MQLTALSFDAMGTNAHVIYGGDDPQHAALAMKRVQQLEQLWSRFIESSEISQINRSAGSAVAASPETLELIERAIEAWEITGGLFDPMVLEQIRALGYDKTFKELATLPPLAPSADAPAGAVNAGRDLLGISVDHDAGTVTANAGRGIDSGGIGKGLAADMVVRSLLDAGSPGALVNLGGDLRSGGESPDGGWRVEVDNPFDPSGPPAARFLLSGQALVTSSSQGRRWRDGDEENHHLLNPSSGQPAVSDIASVTVIADEGWRAEALAKAAFLSGREGALEMLPKEEATGVIVGRDGRLDWVAGSRQYRAPERVVARRPAG
jgi:thiamine biosynthesis lipoprotein